MDAAHGEGLVLSPAEQQRIENMVEAAVMGEESSGSLCTDRLGYVLSYSNLGEDSVVDAEVLRDEVVVPVGTELPRNHISSSEMLSIAITGVGCCLPGGSSLPEHLWSVLQLEVCHISTCPARWSHACTTADSSSALGAVLSGAFIDNLELFLTSRDERKTGDLHCTLLLSSAQSALADSGFCLESNAGLESAVFTAAPTNEFVVSQPSFLVAQNLALGLRAAGTTRNIEESCSSGYLAASYAHQALQDRTCSMCVCAGVSLMLKPDCAQFLLQENMLSLSCEMKPFCNTACGMVLGEACIALVLEPEAVITQGCYVTCLSLSILGFVLVLLSVGIMFLTIEDDPTDLFPTGSSFETRREFLQNNFQRSNTWLPPYATYLIYSNQGIDLRSPDVLNRLWNLHSHFHSSLSLVCRGEGQACTEPRTTRCAISSPLSLWDFNHTHYIADIQHLNSTLNCTQWFNTQCTAVEVSMSICPTSGEEWVRNVFRNIMKQTRLTNLELAYTDYLQYDDELKDAANTLFIPVGAGMFVVSLFVLVTLKNDLWERILLSAGLTTTVSMTSSACLGICGFLDIQLNSAWMICMIVVLAISIDDFFLLVGGCQALKLCTTEQELQNQIQTSFATVGPFILLTTLTDSMVMLSAVWLTPIPYLQSVVIFLSILLPMVMLALMVSIPAICTALELRRIRGTTTTTPPVSAPLDQVTLSDRFFAFIWAACAIRPRLCLAIAAMFTALTVSCAAASFAHLDFDETFTKHLRPSSEFVHYYEGVTSKFGGQQVEFIMCCQNSNFSDPETREEFVGLYNQTRHVPMLLESGDQFSPTLSNGTRSSSNSEFYSNLQSLFQQYPHFRDYVDSPLLVRALCDKYFYRLDVEDFGAIRQVYDLLVGIAQSSSLPCFVHTDYAGILERIDNMPHYVIQNCALACVSVGVVILLVLGWKSAIFCVVSLIVSWCCWICIIYVQGESTVTVNGCQCRLCFLGGLTFHIIFYTGVLIAIGISTDPFVHVTAMLTSTKPSYQEYVNSVCHARKHAEKAIACGPVSTLVVCCCMFASDVPTYMDFAMLMCITIPISILVAMLAPITYMLSQRMCLHDVGPGPLVR